MEVQALSHTPESLEDRVRMVLDHARACGASAAQAIVSHNVGLNVTVRKGEVDTLEYERDQQMALVAHFEQSKGSASTTDFSAAALRQTAEAACRIARYTEPDPYGGLPDPEEQAREWSELELDHPWDCPSGTAIELARRIEAAGFAVDPRIENSEGASVSTRRGMSFLGDSQGFMGGYRSTRHSLSCALVARDAAGMQRDYAYTVSRNPSEMSDPEAVGREAAERTLQRLGSRRIGTRQCPVLFVPEMARGLIGSFTRAISGSAQYRKNSFLLDAVGREIFPAWMQIAEHPHLPKALGSAPFDGEGVRTRDRELISDGVLQSYILDSYSARRLGLRTTGNAGGARNVTVQPHPGDKGFRELLADMGTGLLVTELIGQGVNPVTGDYSRGAAGFWVENGELVHPVEEITIAGNLTDMFRRIVAVGNDVDIRGNTRSGSILVESMTVAGE